jgi:hypothetical protein
MKTNISNFENEHPGDAQLVLGLDQECEQHEAAAIARHLEGCAACRARWEQLRHVSEQIAECHSAIHSGNLSAPRITPDAPRPFGWLARMASFAGAAAAMLCIAWIVTRSDGPTQPLRHAMVRQAVVSPPDASQVTKTSVVPVAGTRSVLRRPSRPKPIRLMTAETFGIVELPFSDRALPLGDAMVVRVEFPIEELRLTGLAVDGDRPGTVVQADVLLGIDGLPRAIRLVR